MTLQPLETSALRAALTNNTGLRLAFVFGSVARGTARSDSDIDLAVLADHALTSGEKIALIEAAARASGRAVDLIDLSTAGQPLLGQILRDGIRLLGNADAQADLATRAALDVSDFLPYVQRMLKHRRLSWIG